MVEHLRCAGASRAASRARDDRCRELVGGRRDRKAGSWRSAVGCASSRVVLGALLTLLCTSLPGCLSTGNEDDSVSTSGKASWFNACEENADCTSGECLCGVCTMACVRDSQCEDLRGASRCADTDEIAQCGRDVSGSVCTYDESQLARPSASKADDDGPDPTDDGAGDAGGSETDEPSAKPSGSAGSGDEMTDDGPVVDPNPNPNPNPGPEPNPDHPTLEGAPDKVDLLFMLDNSISMADKHALLAQTIPDLIAQLNSPPCVADGAVVATPPSASADCPQGSARMFAPVVDIHVGIITSSLGGYGAVADCVQSQTQKSEQTVDMAHLLGSLPRGASVAPSAANGFLSWTASTQPDGFATEFANLVSAAGEFGCGWEASLESWVRFLIEPYPYTKIVRQSCNASDANDLCAGPETDGAGNLLVDATILNQRAQFLRPDSLVGIVIFSDENDCSFKASGQVWRLSQTVNPDGGFNPAFKSTTACDDPAYGPTHQCCHSCGVAAPPPNGCPSAINADGATVGVGCEESRRYASDGLNDHPNLRCFQQKRRFGLDLLYPVERYSNALALPQLCPFSDTLDPADETACPGGQGVVDNPLYSDLSRAPDNPAAADTPRRPAQWVFLTGIVGVPWQDLAESPADTPLVYRSNRQDLDPAERINWNWLIGERHPASGIPDPTDPLMVESITPRSGANPATGESLQPPDSEYLANPINGHEWNVADNSDLQYACIFPLGGEPKACITREEFRNRHEAGEAVPNCDCTDFGSDTFQNPLCQAANGQYDTTQRHAKAYPGLRQLQVLYDFGNNAIVASICPRSIDPTDVDFGYRPAVNAMLSRFAEVLGP